MARRLFIAIDLPRGVRKRLERLVGAPPDGVKPVRAEHMHLTLHFLGDVADETAARLAAALAREVRGPAFTIDLANGGCFPSSARPHVLWIGVLPSGPLHELHGEIARVLAACGLPVESRPFTPHVTLARVTRRPAARWIADFHRATAGCLARHVPVTACVLFASDRTDDGIVHVPLARFPLSR